LDTGALYNTLTLEAFNHLRSFFDADHIDTLLVPASTSAYRLLGNTSRANPAGQWLLLLLSTSTSPTPDPQVVFIGANVTNALAINSLPAASWLHALFTSPPRALPPADLPPWTVQEVIDSTQALSRHSFDIRVFHSLPISLLTAPNMVTTFDFDLDTGSPVNLWPARHRFIPPIATALVPPLRLHLIDGSSYISLTHRVLIQFTYSTHATPNSLFFYVSPQVDVP
jgi:hypothetical protein